MIGVIIAAGLGSRMGVFTESKPKCLLPINEKSLLEHSVDNLKNCGCDKIVVVTGHKSDSIIHPDIIKVRNTDYRNNNILHSLMYAKEYLVGKMIIMYSDIFVEPQIFDGLLKEDGDIVLAVDTDWQSYYTGRTEHPLSEAENALIEGERVVKIGKHLVPDDHVKSNLGEFLGLWTMSEAGTSAFVSAFEEVDTQLQPLEPFQRALNWKKAYITDLIQHMIDSGSDIRAHTIERGWAELDTAQDYERLVNIAAQQRLYSITKDLE